MNLSILFAVPHSMWDSPPSLKDADSMLPCGTLTFNGHFQIAIAPAYIETILSKLADQCTKAIRKRLSILSSNTSKKLAGPCEITISSQVGSFGYFHLVAQLPKSDLEFDFQMEIIIADLLTQFSQELCQALLVLSMHA